MLDEFQVSLVANGSDLRLLELSLQPTSLERTSGKSTYRWNYERLLFGQPVQLDVLGIAAIDRLGSSGRQWLSGLSLLVKQFGCVGFSSWFQSFFQGMRGVISNRGQLGKQRKQDLSKLSAQLREPLAQILR